MSEIGARRARIEAIQHTVAHESGIETGVGTRWPRATPTLFAAEARRAQTQADHDQLLGVYRKQLGHEPTTDDILNDARALGAAGGAHQYRLFFKQHLSNLAKRLDEAVSDPDAAVEARADVDLIEADLPDASERLKFTFHASTNTRVLAAAQVGYSNGLRTAIEETRPVLEAFVASVEAGNDSYARIANSFPLSEVEQSQTDFLTLTRIDDAREALPQTENDVRQLTAAWAQFQSSDSGRPELEAVGFDPELPAEKLAERMDHELGPQRGPRSADLDR